MVYITTYFKDLRCIRKYQKVDEQNRIQFRKSYENLFDLAEERGPSTNTAVPPQNMWSAILPPNDVLQNYLNNTVLKYYPSLDSVPRVTLYYILQTQFSPRMVINVGISKKATLMLLAML